MCALFLATLYNAVAVFDVKMQKKSLIKSLWDGPYLINATSKHTVRIKDTLVLMLL